MFRSPSPRKGDPELDLPPPPAGSARLHALGDLRIFDAEGRSVVSLEAQPKRAALLIYLACLPAGSFCPRDQLLALFWPDFDDERARNSLRTALYYVRRAIGPGVVNSRSDGALETDAQALWCDVRAFEAAIKAGDWAGAADLHRGDFLLGTGLSVSVEFDQWVEAARRRMQRQGADALYRLAEGRERAGDLDGALEALGRARALLPADEAILRRVLLLWGRSGNRVRAVQEYEAFAQTLEALYELEPSEETREILGRVTAGDLPTPPAAPSAAAPAATTLQDDETAVPPSSGEPGDTQVGGPAPALTAPSTEPAQVRRGGWRWSAPPAAAALLAVAALALGWAWGQGAIADGGDTVAVLPFEVFLGGEHLEPLAEALPALLSDELRRGGWRMLEARSLLDLGPHWDDQMKKARELGAGTVVTGQIIALGDSVAILVALVPTSGPPVPSEWARVTGMPADLAAMAAALGRQLRKGPR
ncbi:MAG: BTAD domain-containing putative transcriptional regulator [Longimicrobiales bacterium]|nr:BTAD domain-containing putative transcriptional regulator [Longimicrobiales bacterium]